MSTESNQPRGRALREAEEHFAQVVAGVQDYAIFLLDRHGIVISWNAGAERIKGYAADEIIGKSFSNFYTPEALASRWPDEELVIAAREGRFEEEAWRVRKDGTQFWANVVITTLRDPDGQIRGFLKITRDLTERKGAEETLRQSEERMRLLIDRVKEYAIFMLDPQGRIASWNAGAERIKGYSAAEIIGQHFSAFYSSEDIRRGKPERELAIAREQGSVEDEGWRVRKDRSLFWANVVITALYDEEGVLRGYAKVTRDMTERRKIEALEVADRHKNEFLAMLAHELRNPLAPLRNGVELLKMPGVENTVIHETTDMMERQIVHLVRLVDDLLDVSRIISGKIAFHPEPADLSAVIQRAIEEAQPALDARGHELMLSVPARPFLVNADAVRLSQVFANLLFNAAKYTDKPGQIWLSVERDQEDVVIRICDPGIGISPEMLPNIFSLFVQAQTSLDRADGGLGIGLTLVKRIIDMHGGSVMATSAGAGQGSEFSVRLPISQAVAAASKPSSATRESLSEPKRRILVVDDNVDAALTIMTLLKMWGHEVYATFNGPAALEATRNFRPDIILLDIGLPGMSGYDVARRLREDTASQHLVIAALTGYGQEEDRRRSFEAGFDYHLTKPPDPSLLESLIASPRLRSQQLYEPGTN